MGQERLHTQQNSGGEIEPPMLVDLVGNTPEPATLEEALRPLDKYPYKVWKGGVDVSVELDLPSLLKEATACVKNAQRKLKDDASLGTNPHRIGSIRLYSMNTMYHVVNSSLRSKDRSPESLQPLKPYLKLLLVALRNLPPKFHYKGTVYRGELGHHPDFENKYKNDREIVFYGFTSTTTTAEVLTRPYFCGKTGDRTVFQIDGVYECAYNITSLSNYQDEDEVLFEPCVTFKITQSINFDTGLFTHVAGDKGDNKGLRSVLSKQIEPDYYLLDK